LELKNVKKAWLKFTPNKEIEKNIFKKAWLKFISNKEIEKNIFKKAWLKFTSNKKIEKNIFNTWSCWIRGWLYEVNVSLNLQLEVVWKDLSKAYVKSIKIEKTNINLFWMRWWCLEVEIHFSNISISSLKVDYFWTSPPITNNIQQDFHSSYLTFFKIFFNCWHKWIYHNTFDNI